MTLIALKTNISPGPDSIHPMFLNSTASAIAKPLALPFNCSYNEGRLPQDWKNTVISPIFKKGQIRSEKLSFNLINVIYL